MQNDYPGNDPRTIWQNQLTEPSAMTLLLIRKKTRELHSKTRVELLKSISGPLIVVALGGFGLRFADPVLRVVFAFAVAWSMAGQYFLNRGLWSAAAPVANIPLVTKNPCRNHPRTVARLILDFTGVRSGRSESSTSGGSGIMAPPATSKK